jgi:hypothetical protein
MTGKLLALVAALAFAVGSVLQQKGTLSTNPEGDPRFLTQILRRPVCWPSIDTWSRRIVASP